MPPVDPPDGDVHDNRTVVFFHPDLGIGGAERLVVDAAVGLQSRGYRVVIFTNHCDPSHCFDECRDGKRPSANLGLHLTIPANDDPPHRHPRRSRSRRLANSPLHPLSPHHPLRHPPSHPPPNRNIPLVRTTRPQAYRFLCRPALRRPAPLAVPSTSHADPLLLPFSRSASRPWARSLCSEEGLSRAF